MLGCCENPVTSLLLCLVSALGHSNKLLSFDEFFITFQGTHDFQNITVNSSSPGVITVAGDFISGYLTNVILVMIYSENLGDVHVYYMFSSQSVEEVIKC